MYSDDSTDEGGWRRNPTVAVAAVAVALLALSTLVCRVACRERAAPSPTDQSVMMICPHCGTTYKVSAKDVGVEEDVIADVVQQRAASTPCPKCGKTDCVPALICPKCAKPFAPPKTTDQTKAPTCPHCGASLWGTK